MRTKGDPGLAAHLGFGIVETHVQFGMHQVIDAFAGVAVLGFPSRVRVRVGWLRDRRNSQQDSKTEEQILHAMGILATNITPCDWRVLFFVQAAR